MEVKAQWQGHGIRVSFLPPLHSDVLLLAPALTESWPPRASTLTSPEQLTTLNKGFYPMKMKLVLVQFGD